DRVARENLQAWRDEPLIRRGIAREKPAGAAAAGAFEEIEHAGIQRLRGGRRFTRRPFRGALGRKAAEEEEPARDLRLRLVARRPPRRRRSGPGCFFKSRACTR